MVEELNIGELCFIEDKEFFVLCYTVLDKLPLDWTTRFAYAFADNVIAKLFTDKSTKSSIDFPSLLIRSVIEAQSMESFIKAHSELKGIGEY